VGDRVLKVVAQVLKESVRTVDLVARYGGEEFSVLLLKTPALGAQTVAERIREKISEKEIIASQEATHITVSIGWLSWSPLIKKWKNSSTRPIRPSTGRRGTAKTAFGWPSRRGRHD